MYGIYKLAPTSQEFIRTLGSNSKITAIALGKALCDSFPIPTAPVDAPETFFQDHLFSSIKEKLAFLNELTVLNVEMVKDMVQTFWCIRYATVYPKDILFIPMAGAGISPFFGFETKLASADYEFIEANIVNVVKQMNGFKAILKEMNTTKDA